MLAQNFLCAKELGISEEERAALISLLGRLERGELPHISSLAYKMRDFEGDGFQMGGYRIQHGCGTAGCIAGWVSFILKENYAFAYEFAARTPALDNLCHVIEHTDAVVGMDDITPTQAATALRSYLTTGHANWNEALAAA